MTKGELDFAVRKALNMLDEWNEIAGVVRINTGHYYELQAVVEQAVHIGVQMAINGEITVDEHGSVKKPE
jgi:hypothetical protein